MDPTDRGLGVHYTPEPLARFLSERVLADGPATPVLDPACGDGALLIAAWRVGAERGLRPEWLHGIELDPGRAQAAQNRLRREIGGEGGDRAAENIRVADALDPATLWPVGTAILANPPWVSFSGRQASVNPQGSGRASKAGGWPSLHGAFLERIAAHLRAHRTRAGALIPSALCELERYGPTRARVRTYARLLAPALTLGEDSFPGVVEPAVLLLLGPDPGWADPAPWPVGQGGSGIRERLARFPRLAAACYGDLGVHTGNSAAQLILDPGVGLPGVREGRDLGPYRLGPPRRALDTRVQRSKDRRFRFGRLEAYRGVPVLLRQTADRPIAALHTDPTYFRNSLLACRPPDGLDPAFAVAVLNNPVLARWHRESFLDARQRSFPQVKISHLRSAPFPITLRSEAPALHDRVARAVRALLHPMGESDFDARVGAIESWIADAFGEPLD